MLFAAMRPRPHEEQMNLVHRNRVHTQHSPPRLFTDLESHYSLTHSVGKTRRSFCCPLPIFEQIFLCDQGTNSTKCSYMIFQCIYLYSL